MISVRSLTKYYGSLRALHDVSFELNKGEIVGILGPNGSGKTTLLRILTTYLEPTSGEASVNSYDIFKNSLELRRTVGYLPENNILYMNMTVKDYLAFVGKARGLKGVILKDRLNWCVDALALEDVVDKKCHVTYQEIEDRFALSENSDNC